MSVLRDAAQTLRAGGMLALAVSVASDMALAAGIALAVARAVRFVSRFMHLSPSRDASSHSCWTQPVLDWASVIGNTVAREHIAFMGAPLRWMIGARISVDWSALDEIAQAHTFRLPILLFQGEDDPLVPPRDSRAFARVAPGPVTYVSVPEAGHIESWNADPGAYERHLRDFLAPFLSAGRSPIER